jgi:hypothetical protein
MLERSRQSAAGSPLARSHTLLTSLKRDGNDKI